MSDASQLHAANEGEDSRASTPADSGASEKSSSKWVWQVETTAQSSVAESEKSSSKWVWQVETTRLPPARLAEEGSNKRVWQVETTPLPPPAGSEESPGNGIWQVGTTPLPSVAEPEENPGNGVWQVGATSLPPLAGPEKSAGKWVWQVETTVQPSVAEPGKGSGKWVWQVETTRLPPVAVPEESSNKRVWQVGTTPLPSVADSEFLWDQPDQPQEGGIEGVPAASQEVTLKLAAQSEALPTKQTAVPPWLLAAGAALFAAYLVFWNLSDSTLNVGNRAESLGSQLVLGAALIAIFAGIVRLVRMPRWPSFHIKQWVLLPIVFIVLIAGVLIPQAAIILSLDGQQYLSSQDGQQFSVYRQSAVDPYFSLAYPSDWPFSVKVNNGGLTAVLFMNPDSNSSGYFVVVRHLLDPHEQVSFQSDLKSYLGPLCEGCSFVPQQTTTQGPWQRIRYREGNQAGIAWVRDINEQRVILTALTDPADMAQDEPVYTAIAASWRPGLTATIPAIGPTPAQERQILSGRVLPWISGLLPFFAGLLALPVLWWRRKRAGTIAACALFFLVLGILQFAYYLPAFIAPHLPQVQLDFYASSVLLASALGSLIALCWLLFKRQITRKNSRLLTLLLALNAVLACIAVVISMVAQVSLPPGTLAAQWLAGGKLWLQVGLLHVALPLLLTLFMLQGASWWGSRKQEKAVWAYGTAVAGIEESIEKRNT